MRKVICAALICLMAYSVLYIPKVSAQSSGPQADVTRFKVIKGSDPLNLRLNEKRDNGIFSSFNN